MQTIALGPLALPTALLLFFAAVGAGWTTGARLARRGGAGFDLPAYAVLGCGLLAARIGFVLAYRDAYLGDPLTMMNLRDGGWSPVAGLAAGAACAVLLATWRPVYAKPLALALGAGGAVWLAGALLLFLARPAAQSLPPLVLTDPSGRPVALGRFQGRPLAVNLWATWCPPCRREMPVLRDAQRARPDVEFVFVDQGESAAAVQSFLARQRLALRNVLLDPGSSASRQLAQRALPTTLFFDARGRLVATHVGELSAATLQSQLEAIAASHAPASGDPPTR
jgi:thiol-disulfide isomerase/thioredoxin